MIPNPYLLLAAICTAMGLFIGGYLYGGHVKDLAWEASTAKLQAAAATTLAAETAKSAAIDARNAELARTIEETHAQALQAIDATRADFSRRLRIAGSRARSCDAAFAAAADPGIRPNPAGSGDGEYGGPDFESGRRLRDYALNLQAYAVACHAFAVQVGR